MRNLIFQKPSLSSRPFIIFAWAVGALLSGLPPVHASNPWGRAVGEAIALRDVTRDMRNRSERLFPRTPIAFLATAQNETACNLYNAIQRGAPGQVIATLLAEFQLVQSRLHQAVCVDRIAANDHGLRTYRRLVKDRFLDLTRDLDRCNCARILPYSTYRFDEQLFFEQPFVEAPARVPQSRRMIPQAIFPEQNGFGEAVEF